MFRLGPWNIWVPESYQESGIRNDKWVRRKLGERKGKLMSTYPLSDITPIILKALSVLIFPPPREMFIILSHFTDEKTEV